MKEMRGSKTYKCWIWSENLKCKRQKMKNLETINEYSNRLLSIVNYIRLFGADFSEFRIIQNILVTILEKFEATILFLENSKDLSSIT